MSSVNAQIRESINQIKNAKGQFGILDGNEISNMLETPINTLNNVWSIVSDIKINNNNDIEHIIYLLGKYMCSNGYLTSLSAEYGSAEFTKDIKVIKDPNLSEVMEYLVSMLKYNKEV